MDQGLPVESPPDRSYPLSGKIMISAIVVLFAVVLFMVCLHLYARWYVLRLRRRRRSMRALIYVDNHDPRSVADRGLEPSVLNSLPVFQYSSKKAAAEPLSSPSECAVCLSEFGEEEVVRLLPKCGHSFHVDCIGMWFHSHSTCPLCRSPVEAVVSLAEPPEMAEEAVEEGNSSEPSSSSGTELCATCQHDDENTNTTSLWGRRKAFVGGIIGIRIEAPPPQRTESENDTTQSSPGGTRLLSLKRLFSMTRKTPVGSGRTTPHVAAGSSGGAAAEMDLEGGFIVPAGSQTPR